MTWTVGKINQEIDKAKSMIRKFKNQEMSILKDCKGRPIEELPKAYKQFMKIKMSKSNMRGRLKLLLEMQV